MTMRRLNFADWAFIVCALAVAAAVLNLVIP